MRIFLSAFLLFVLTISCPAQEVFRYGYTKPFLGMKGKVKTLTEETYDISLKDDSIENRKLSEKRVFEFDKDGFLKKKTTYFGKDKNIITFRKNKAGRTVRFERQSYFSDQVAKDSIRLFEINKNNDLLVSWNNYNKEYASVDTTKIKYIADMTVIHPMANKGRLKIEEHYDKNGNMTQEWRTLYGDVRSWYEQFYDENNLLIKRQYIDPHYYALHYFYDKYDKQGNWQERTIKQPVDKYDEDSELITISVTIRQIKYY
jgi:hypothetical protein